MSEIERVLDPLDAFCPKCGHNRDTSSVSSVDEGNGRKSCQMCGAKWSEGRPDVSMEDAAKRVAEAVWTLADVASMPRQLPMPVHEAAKEALTLALVRFAAAIRRGSV